MKYCQILLYSGILMVASLHAVPMERAVDTDLLANQVCDTMDDLIYERLLFLKFGEDKSFSVKGNYDYNGGSMALELTGAQKNLEGIIRARSCKFVINNNQLMGTFALSDFTATASYRAVIAAKSIAPSADVKGSASLTANPLFCNFVMTVNDDGVPQNLVGMVPVLRHTENFVITGADSSPYKTGIANAVKTSLESMLKDACTRPIANILNGYVRGQMNAL